MRTSLTHWPERAVVRLVVLAQVRATEAGCRLFGGDFTRWVLATPLIRQVVADGAAATGLSINALAQSMGLPYETVRRQARAMIVEGLCERSATGLILAEQALAAARSARLTDFLAANVVSLIGNLAAIGVDLPGGRSRDAGRDLALLALDLNLLGMESWHRITPSLVDMRLLGAITVANCRPFTADHALSLQYGTWDAPPPEAIKRPITLRALAERLDLAYATTWRSVQRLLGSGSVALTPDGLVTVNAPLDATYADQRRRTSSYLRRHLARLAATGLSLASIGADELAGRADAEAFASDDPFGFGQPSR